MKRYANPRGTLLFIALSVTLMVAVDFLFLRDDAPRDRDFMPSKSALVSIDESVFQHSEIQDYSYNVPEEKKSFEESLASLLEEERVYDHPPAPLMKKAKKEVSKAVVESRPAPAVKKPPAEIKVESIPYEGKPKIVIIIDDLGMDRKRTEQVINLPGPITLAFLPYAPKLDEDTKTSLSKGHELLIHTPMEPMDGKMNPGPIALMDDMNEQQLKVVLEQVFKSFDGYVGINNHMGSRLTQNQKAMDVVMEALSKRDLLFVDSKTINTSVAAQTARNHNLRYAERDVFLDHENTPEFVAQSLRKMEIVARNRGQAIGIGHPKEATINGLRAWIPTLEKKGFEIVPVSAVVRREKRADQVTPAAAISQGQIPAALSSVVTFELAPGPSLRLE